MSQLYSVALPDCRSLGLSLILTRILKLSKVRKVEIMSWHCFKSPASSASSQVTMMLPSVLLTILAWCYQTEKNIIVNCEGHVEAAHLCHRFHLIMICCDVILHPLVGYENLVWRKTSSQKCGCDVAKRNKSLLLGGAKHSGMSHHRPTTSSVCWPKNTHAWIFPECCSLILVGLLADFWFMKENMRESSFSMVVQISHIFLFCFVQ